MSSKRDHSRARQRVSIGETLGVLACLLGAVMIMCSGWLLSSSKAAQNEARGTSGVTVPL